MHILRLNFSPANKFAAGGSKPDPTCINGFIELFSS